MLDQLMVDGDQSTTDLVSTITLRQKDAGSSVKQIQIAVNIYLDNIIKKKLLERANLGHVSL
jgi:hypothetical protein